MFAHNRARKETAPFFSRRNASPKVGLRPVVARLCLKARAKAGRTSGGRWENSVARSSRLRQALCAGDNWTVVCSSDFWERGATVRLKHVDTDM